MAINSIRRKLNDCVIFLDGEPVNNSTDSVENFVKRKESRDKDSSTIIIHGSIYHLCVSCTKAVITNSDIQNNKTTNIQRIQLAIMNELSDTMALLNTLE